ncbi:MAG TPA: PAS domain S-box protein [Armatimonadota bacterium]
MPGTGTPGNVPGRQSGQQQGRDADGIDLRIARICGVATFIIGCAGILGWVTGVMALSSIFPGYKPIAISASLVFLLLGGVQFLAARPRLPRDMGIVLLVVSALVVLFDLFEVIQLITGALVSIEDAILRHYPMRFANPDTHIAPAASMLVFFISSLLVLYLYQRITEQRTRTVFEIIGGVSSLIVLGSTTFILGYIYQAPLQYGSTYIPISLSAALAAAVSGIGLVNMAGNDVFPLSWLTGPSTRAQLLRVFLPLTALMLLILSLLQYFLLRLTNINPAVSAALLIVLFELVFGAVIVQVSRVMGNLIDHAQVELRQAETELRQSEARLRTVLETLPIGVLIVDTENHIVESNGHAERIYSGDAALPEPLHQYRLGKSWWTDSGKPVEPHEWPSMQALRQGQVVPGEEIDILRADGTRATTLDAAAPLYDSEGRIVGAVVVIQDISDRKRVEQELRRLTETLEQRVQERTAQLTQAFEREQVARREAETAQAYFQGVLESAPDGIVIVDADGRITLVNNQTEQLSGYTRDALLGKPVEVLIPERYGEIHPRHRATFMAEPRTRPMGVGLDLFLRRSDGTEVPVEISLSPFRAPAGMLVTASIRDITARKQAEAEIQRLNSELQQHVEQLKTTNKELEAFSYSVSHDLRAPLRSIDGFSKVLLERYEQQLDERGQDYLNRVRAAAQRMARLIDDMLNLSRIGRAEMHLETVDLGAVASSIIEELRQRDPERQVEVVMQPEMVVMGDPALLRIVLVNLLSNAWKFTGKREDARIEIGQELSNGERVFFVRDNGAGFDMAYADKLFSPFQRLHTEEEFPGTGIGLAIVQRILARHGGRVWAEGVEGQGATFYFTLGEQP